MCYLLSFLNLEINQCDIIYRLHIGHQLSKISESQYWSTATQYIYYRGVQSNRNFRILPIVNW